MYQTVEAIIKNGQITPVEPIDLTENVRYLLVKLDPSATGYVVGLELAEKQKKLAKLRATRGAYAGKLSSVDEFIAHKQNEKDLDR